MAGITSVRVPIRVGGYPTRSPALRRRCFTSRSTLTSGGRVITLAGELDVATAPAVKACFEVFDVRHAPRVVVEVARLSFCDCAGLSAFLHAHRRALVGDGWFRLCAASPRLRKMIAITGLASTLRCYPTAADAFADVE